MDACLGHLLAGTPVSSISVHPTRPGRWLLSRCEIGAIPIIVEFPATQPVPPSSLALQTIALPF